MTLTPMTNAIMIPQKGHGDTEMLPPTLMANPQASYERDLFARSLDSNGDRMSLGSIGSDLGWDLPASREPDQPLLDDLDFARISRDFASTDETLSAEKKSMQKNMDELSGFMDHSYGDEMERVWSDCYFSFARDGCSSRGKTSSKEEKRFGLMPTAATMESRRTFSAKPAHNFPRQAFAAGSQSSATLEAKSFWLQRNKSRSCCGWGSTSQSKTSDLPVKGEYPSPVKVQRHNMRTTDGIRPTLLTCNP